MDNAKKELLKKYIAELYKYLEETLKLTARPIIVLTENVENAQDVFGLTGYFNPELNTIKLYITDRHPKDILRTLAHECVHLWQHQNGKFENIDNTTEDGYAQTNPHLRKMEQQAYLVGSMLFRDFCDTYKDEHKPIHTSSKTNTQK